MGAGLEERVLNHDKQLVKLETVLERVANNQDKMSDSIEKLADAVTRIANYEENHKSSFARVHKRLDETNEKINEVDNDSKNRKKEIDRKLESINFLFVAFKYPKTIGFSAIGLYAIAISDVKLLNIIKLLG